jgi:hypothetical protein
MAIIQRNPAIRLIVHSDRGTQYASNEHQALLTKHGLIGCMSRRGNCWDNAVMERFFLNLKMQRAWQTDYAKHSEAANDIADYIVGFYNSTRLHSKLGNLSPDAFERESTSKKSIELSEITWPLQSKESFSSANWPILACRGIRSTVGFIAPPSKAADARSTRWRLHSLIWLA